jgi:hypothetical protein
MAPGSAVGTRSEETDQTNHAVADEEAEEMAVSAFESSPDRLVFSEDGNPDGWIATDLAMEPPR